MGKRQNIALGMAAGALWAVVLLWAAATYVQLPVFTLMPTIMTAFLAPGLVMVAMVGRLAQRRFFDDSIIDGQDFALGSPAWIDQKVLANTMEQAVLALVIWPFVATTLGGFVVLVMGVSFALSRLVFWVGYHLSPPLRGLGFAATFYTTVLAAIWSIAVWVG